MCVHGILMNQTIRSYVPNTISGLVPVDRGMVPKTAVDMDMFGWVAIRLVLPKYNGLVQYS